jgi:hypothetical protein
VLPGRDLDRGNQPICRSCAGISADFTCRGCGTEDDLYRHGTCARCALRDDLTVSMIDGAHDPEAMVPIVDALCRVDRPASILTWKLSPMASKPTLIAAARVAAEAGAEQTRIPLGQLLSPLVVEPDGRCVRPWSTAFRISPRWATSSVVGFVISPRCGRRTSWLNFSACAEVFWPNCIRTKLFRSPTGIRDWLLRRPRDS